MDELQAKTISEAPIPNPNHLITIYSGFTISQEQGDRLIATIREQIAANAEIQFETDEDLICGIELRDRGYKISWNLENYLTAIEVETAKILAENNNRAA